MHVVFVKRLCFLCGSFAVAFVLLSVFVLRVLWFKERVKSVCGCVRVCEKGNCG